jgi:hypothetical protein
MTQSIIARPLGLGSDSAWGDELDERRSTGSFICFLDGAGVSWKVKLTPTVCLSTQEAEYSAQTDGTKEALDLRMLLRDLGFGQREPTGSFGKQDIPIVLAPIHHLVA